MITLRGRLASRAPRVKLCFHVSIYVICMSRCPERPAAASAAADARPPCVSLSLSVRPRARGRAHARARPLSHTVVCVNKAFSAYIKK